MVPSFPFGLGMTLPILAQLDAYFSERVLHAIAVGELEASLL